MIVRELVHEATNGDLAYWTDQVDVTDVSALALSAQEWMGHDQLQ